MRIAVFLPTWVGDACMATPAIRAIRNGLPEITELCLVGRYAPLAILEGNPWSDSQILYKPRSKTETALSRRQLVVELRRKGIETILLLPNSFSSACMAYFSGATRRVGYARDGRSWLLTDRIELTWNGVDLRRIPTIDYYMHIARHMGCACEDRRMELFLSSEDREKGVRAYEQFGFDASCPTIVLNTASAANDARMWPTPSASLAARTLAERFGFQVVIHCGPADRSRANEIAGAAGHAKVQSMGQLQDLPLGLSKALIEQSTFVISTDSGPRHIAAALNKRVISLFGPTDPSLYQTYNQPEIVLREKLGCSPCGKNRCPLKHNQCMRQLSPSRVIDAVCKLFEDSGDLQVRESGRGLPRSAA